MPDVNRLILKHRRYAMALANANAWRVPPAEFHRLESAAMVALWGSVHAPRFIRHRVLRAINNEVRFITKVARGGNVYVPREYPEPLPAVLAAEHRSGTDAGDWWERVTATLNDVQRAVIALLRDGCDQRAIARLFGRSVWWFYVVRDRAFAKIRLAAVAA